MSSDSSGRNVSPRGSSSSTSRDNKKEKKRKTRRFPPPYWQEKIAKNYDTIKLLENNLDLRYALHRSPTLAGEFMKHPEVSREVVRDKKLATEIIRRPHLLEELANFHHYAHRQKRQKKVKEFVKKLEKEYIEENYNDPSGLVIPTFNKNLKKKDSASEESMAIARATLPNVVAAVDEPITVKYIMKSSRLFLRHDICFEHGHGCLTKKISYYNVLNAHGRLMYRVFRRHKQTQGHFRPYELVVKDPDGVTICIFAQVKDKRYRHKLAVQYPLNNVIGYVEQKWGLPFTISKMYLKNKDNERMIQIACIRRPLISYCRYHSQFIFELRAFGAHNVIGKISREWIDTPPGAFESERIYGVCFPRDLSPQVKIIILAAWVLVYMNYYSGKLERCVHHALTEEEKALIRLVEDKEDEVYRASPESSSDSEDDKDKAVIDHYQKQFQVAAISAKKRIGIGHIVEDVNENDKDSKTEY